MYKIVYNDPLLWPKHSFHLYLLKLRTVWEQLATLLTHQGSAYSWIVHCCPWPSEETKTLPERCSNMKKQKRVSVYPKKSEFISKWPIAIVKCVWILSSLRKQCRLYMCFIYLAFVLIDLAFCDFIDLFICSWITCTCVSGQLSGAHSLLLPWVPGNEFRLSYMYGKHHYPLSSNILK